MFKEALPPLYDIDAEMGLLGSLLIDPSVFASIKDVVDGKDFYRDTHRWLYDAIIKLDKDGQPFDFITLPYQLRGEGKFDEMGGEGFLIDVLNAVPTSLNVESYAHIVRGMSLKRSVLHTMQLVASRLGKDDDAAQDTVLATQLTGLLGEWCGGRTTPPPTIKQVAQSFLDGLYDPPEEKISCGFADVDKLIQFHPSDFVVVAGRTGMGKTALCLAFALAMCKQGKSVALFSLEMNTDQLFQRLVAAEGLLNLNRRKRADEFSDDELDRVYGAAGRISELPLHLIDCANGQNPESADKMLSICRKLKEQQGLDVVIVDYIQLMQTAGGNRNRNRVEEISEITRKLKKLAMELKVTVIAGSQISRMVEGRQDKRPTLSDLRESGSIEQDADGVLMIYRDSYYNSTSPSSQAEIIVAKNRHGKTGVAPIYWSDTLTTFRNFKHQVIDLNAL